MTCHTRIVQPNRTTATLADELLKPIFEPKQDSTGGMPPVEIPPKGGDEPEPTDWSDMYC